MADTPVASSNAKSTALLVIEAPRYNQRVQRATEITGQGFVRTTGHVAEISMWLNGHRIGTADLIGERDPTRAGGEMPIVGFRFLLVPNAIGPTRVVFRALVTETNLSGKQQAELLGTLHLTVVEPQIPARPHGFIDYYGYSRSCRGWLIGGWIPHNLSPSQLGAALERASEVRFTNLHLNADNYTIALFDRADIDDVGSAFLVFIAADSRKTGDLITCNLQAAPDEGAPLGVELRANALSARLVDPMLVSRARDDIGKAAPSDAVASLNRLFSQQGYTGESTLDQLRGIHLAVDEAISCPHGLLLIGWIYDPRHEIARIVLYHNDDATTIPIECAVKIERPDVAKAFEDTYGTVDPSCGFITFISVPDFADRDPSLYIEVISKRGAIGYQTIPEGKLRGMAAIKRILGTFAARYSDVNRTLSLLGPAIAQLNSERLAVPVGVAEVQFGDPPDAPVCSVVVPVHGRCEFVEDQMALFSRNDGSGAYEFIYVLDDPPRKSEFLSLCESIFNRFHVPITVLLLAENVGFAPASNVGLAHGRGEFICFLNSDVFPKDDNWLDGLIQLLRSNPKIGIIGPLLVFEDETVQHCGITFEKLVEFGNLPFPLHTTKGFALKERQQVAEVTAITGACMVMRRSLAETMDGFDESFIIGDFEDADLCLRIRQTGQVCAVDPSIRLYHLERQSQMTSRTLWRMNLTLYNAWTHAARWSDVLDGEAVETVKSRGSLLRPERQPITEAMMQ